MRLPGRLDGTTLGDVLGALYRAGLSGTLELEENRGAGSGRVHRIELESGLIGEIETPLCIPRVGELLRDRGCFGDRTVLLLGELLRASPGRRVGELLLERAWVSVELLYAALDEQRKKKLDALYALPDALIRFRVPRGRGRGAARALPPREFLHGRPRARDLCGSSRRGVAPAPLDAARREALSKLGLGEGADAAAIRRAFRELAAQRHPDRFPHAALADRLALVRQFAELTAAYHLLVA